MKFCIRVNIIMKVLESQVTFGTLQKIGNEPVVCVFT